MPTSSSPRVTRKNKPRRKFSENTYRKAKPYLLADFSQRCAYSLQHVARVGWSIIEIDHFDPTLKGAQRNKYENLYPSTRHCNGSKSSTWPTKEQRHRGIRFLDPCKEADYGQQIFEDPVSHELIGITPAAKFHIRVMGLNAPFLVNERAERTALHQLFDQTPVRILNASLATEQMKELRDQLDRMIPPIASHSC
jgi:hypothetical protein